MAELDPVLQQAADALKTAHALVMLKTLKNLLITLKTIALRLL